LINLLIYHCMDIDKSKLMDYWIVLYRNYF